MPIRTELVGSLPRPMKLQQAYADYDEGKIDWQRLQTEQDAAAEDSIRRLEATGEPIVTDGEQRESSFATYSITDTLAGTGLADNLAGDGQFFAIFDDGHHRQLPRLTAGPFRYKYASEFVAKNIKVRALVCACAGVARVFLLDRVDAQRANRGDAPFVEPLVDLLVGLHGDAGSHGSCQLPNPLTRWSDAVGPHDPWA